MTALQREKKRPLKGQGERRGLSRWNVVFYKKGVRLRTTRAISVNVSTGWPVSGLLIAPPSHLAEIDAIRRDDSHRKGLKRLNFQISIHTVLFSSALERLTCRAGAQLLPSTSRITANAKIVLCDPGRTRWTHWDGPRCRLFRLFPHVRCLLASSELNYFLLSKSCGAIFFFAAPAKNKR